jgi:lysophospholipase L1-like esterase
VAHFVLTAPYLYRAYLTRLPSLDFLTDIDAESGAVGANRAWSERGEGHRNVRRQEIGELLVCQGLTIGSSEKVSLGMRAVSFGLSLQNADGSFPQHEFDEHSYPGTAFFLCSAASALLMMSAAEAPDARALRKEWRPRLARSASWLAIEPPHHPDVTNHVCAAAGGVSMLSEVCVAAKAAGAAGHLCGAACELQNEDGSWSERGGTDTHYQAVSLIYMTYALLACDHQETRRPVRACPDRGFRWLADRVGEDGSVDCAHNTRKRWDRRPPDNEAITASDFIAVSYAFHMWADITGETEWASLAERVESWIERVKPGGDRTVWEAMVAGNSAARAEPSPTGVVPGRRVWEPTRAVGVVSSSFDADTRVAVRRVDMGFKVQAGQRVLIKGDSIASGYGFGTFEHPSPLNSIQGMAGVFVGDNLENPPEFLQLPGIPAGTDERGLAICVATMAEEIQRNIERGELRPGDWLIFQEAGQADMTVHPPPWPWTERIYEQMSDSFRAMVLAAEGAVGRDHIILSNTFDFDPLYPMCAWDEYLDDGVHTGNDVFRTVAEELGVALVDMNHIMDKAECHLLDHGWGSTCGPDGIHPNVFGNYVMMLGFLAALGADLAKWRLDGLHQHFKHPDAGGDVEELWGFFRDPSDTERLAILQDLRRIVLSTLPAGNGSVFVSIGQPSATSPRGIKRVVYHGKVLDHPAAQPEGTSAPVSYELGRPFQLDKDHCLLIASMREQGGHDFEVGNDAFVFTRLSEIRLENAIPVNRVNPRYRLSSGEYGVQAKYIANGGFVPVGARVGANAEPHPAAGTGFLLSDTVTYLPDRSVAHPRRECYSELIQLRWDGRSLSVGPPIRLDDVSGMRISGNLLSNLCPQDTGFLCPFSFRDHGLAVVRFEYDGERWAPMACGPPFGESRRTHSESPQAPIGEAEASIQRAWNGYLVRTRGSDPNGRYYWSRDGLDYRFIHSHWNHTVPQTLNKGLDGSLYLATNIGPGWLRNPLYAFEIRDLRPRSGPSPYQLIFHDEKGIRTDAGREVPFCDHAISANVFLEARWRHLCFFRVCDLRETNGEGAPPTPATGVYLVELEYEFVSTGVLRSLL